MPTFYDTGFEVPVISINCIILTQKWQQDVQI